ncbi:MAG: hypothetical protein FWD17_16785 [Polyangiaceae bacterium]|nr:hypothetical protein [Polyangiaceae bacterium]
MSWISPSAHAAELPKASDAVHGSSSSPSSRASAGRARAGRSGHNARGSDESDVSGTPLGKFLSAVVFAPFVLPNIVVEADTPPDGWSLGSYPYADGTSGYLRAYVPPPAPDEDTPAPDVRRKFAFQLGVDGLMSAGGNYGRVQASARVLSIYRVDLDAEYGYYAERAPGGGVASAGLGRAHLTYRFAESDHVHFRGGVGVRHWADAAGWAAGPDFNYAIDIFWGRPMTTSLEASGGLLGHGFAGQLRGTVGVVVGQAELFAGYDAIWIGASGKPSAYLGGPIAGVRAYF